MGKKRYNKPSPIREVYPDLTTELTPELHQASDNTFVVYQIKNGYLLNPHTQHTVGYRSLVYCKDIQDLTDQILSTQAQLRLNLQPAKTTY